MSDFFLIAKIVNRYGNNGFVKAVSFSDFPERFVDLKEVYLDFFGMKKKFFIEEVKQLKDAFAFKFVNFSEDDELEVLINREVFVDESNLASLPKDTYYIHELIGSKVILKAKEIGVIVDVLTGAAQDIYVINDVNKKEILLPAVKAFIISFDRDKKIFYLSDDAVIDYDEE